MQQGSTTLAGYAYDSAGRLQQVSRSNGTVSSYSYDGADRLTGLKTLAGSSVRSAFSYQPDRLGQTTVVTETLAQGNGAHGAAQVDPPVTSVPVADAAGGSPAASRIATVSAGSVAGQAAMPPSPAGSGTRGAESAVPIAGYQSGPDSALAWQPTGRTHLAATRSQDRHADATQSPRSGGSDLRAVSGPAQRAPGSTLDAEAPSLHLQAIMAAAATATRTHTPIPATATRTHTPIPATATRTHTPTVTATATRTSTPSPRPRRGPTHHPTRRWPPRP